VLRVPALHMEANTGAEDLDAVHGELQELATWLGLGKVSVDRLITSQG
jgi:hypothetical protein